MGRLASITPTQTLSDQAYEIIKEAIVTNELKPGELLIEGKLAVQLNISRTPIRTALRRLMQERLVMVSNRSIEVADISFSEMCNIMQVRRLVEPGVIRSLEGKLQADNITELKCIQDELKMNIDHEKYRNYVDLDKKFHMYFIKMLDNSYLEDIFEQLLTNYGRLAILSGTCKTHGKVATWEHDRLLQALSEEDCSAAETSLLDHLQNIYKRYCEYFDKKA